MGTMGRQPTTLYGHFVESKRLEAAIKKTWYLFYSQWDTIAKQPASLLRQQPVAILARIPWGHNLAIISKCSTVEQALFYVRKTVENN